MTGTVTKEKERSVNLETIIFPMKDGGIVEYKDDTEYIPGCETCDYGSQYLNNIFIKLTKFTIDVRLDRMYEYSLSSGDIMTTILPEYQQVSEMTEEEFSVWFKEKLIDLVHTQYHYESIKESIKCLAVYEVSHRFNLDDFDTMMEDSSPSE